MTLSAVARRRLEVFITVKLTIHQNTLSSTKQTICSQKHNKLEKLFLTKSIEIYLNWNIQSGNKVLNYLLKWVIYLEIIMKEDYF